MNLFSLQIIVYDLAGLVKSVNTTVTEVAWAVFLLAWGVGWALRGSPVPIFKVKKGGQDVIEDAVIAALAFAIGSTVFSFISYIASQIQAP